MIFFTVKLLNHNGNFHLRQLFIFENSKILIQATIIDKYWLATSKKCCLNKQDFQVVFNDKDKQRWIFMGKAQQSGCKRKKCKKSRPRFNEEC